MENMFPKNLTYILDNKLISVKTILNITGNKSPGLITMWKNGERNIMTEDILKIANFLNCTIDDLYNKDFSKLEKYKGIEYIKELIISLPDKEILEPNKKAIINMIDFYHQEAIKTNNNK